MKILFAGTPEFAVAPLQALYEQHQVVAVFTQPDRRAGRGKKLTAPPVKLEAIARDIPVYQPESLRDQTSIIKALNVDVMVVVAYGMLLPQTILDLPRLGCINIHASLLPRWRGAAPIQRAIQAGDTDTGVSIMQMELGLDTGPVYSTLKIPILTSDTSASLHDKLAVLGATGILATLDELQANPLLTPQTQDHSQANYAHKISKSEAHIDWSQSATKLDQLIRAFNPWPICQTEHQGNRMRIWQAQVSQLVHTAPPGEIIRVTADALTVACGVGALNLKLLQRDGSKPLAVREFCNGYALAMGDVFASPASTSNSAP